MRDYASLTRAGKLRRLARLAARALDRFELDVAEVRLHCFATNLIYRVRTGDGRLLILRLASPGWRTLENLQAEASWLEALDRDTDVGAPTVIPATSGESVLAMCDPGIPGVWHTTLMTWVEGKLLAHFLNRGNLEKMGELFATLHRYGKSWKPPGQFSPQRFGAYLSRGEPEVLFEDEVIGTFSRNDRRRFIAARGWVEEEYARLDPDDLRVIHCDLWHENIKLDRGRLRPFDFEDTIWGYRLHDLAMGLLDLLETVGPTAYPELADAVRVGYERHLRWPEGRLEVLQIGRLLWKANYFARFVRKGLPPMVVSYGRTFEHFERTGVLCLHAETPGAGVT